MAAAALIADLLCPGGGGAQAGAAAIVREGPLAGLLFGRLLGTAYGRNGEGREYSEEADEEEAGGDPGGHAQGDRPMRTGLQPLWAALDVCPFAARL